MRGMTGSDVPISEVTHLWQGEWIGRVERDSKGTREDDGPNQGSGRGRGSRGQNRMWVEGCMGSVSVSVREEGSQKDPNFVAHG